MGSSADFLTPRKGRAGLQRCAEQGPKVTACSPEGEVLWRGNGDPVWLTPGVWLVYLVHGKGCHYASQPRATPELVAAMRGQSVGQLWLHKCASPGRRLRRGIGAGAGFTPRQRLRPHHSEGRSKASCSRVASELVCSGSTGTASEASAPEAAAGWPMTK